jgi:hypothetical protein
MPKVKLEITEEILSFVPPAMSSAARVALRYLDRQAAAGISARGTRLPGGVDLHGSGETWGTAEPGETGDPRQGPPEGYIEFKTPHAQYLFTDTGGKYDAADIAPINRQAFEDEVGPVLDRGAVLIERGKK